MENVQITDISTLMQSVLFPSDMDPPMSPPPLPRLFRGDWPPLFQGQVKLVSLFFIAAVN